MSENKELDLGRMIDGFTVENILHLLTGAWEGGSNYWIKSVEMKGSYDLKQRPEQYFPTYALAPFIGGHLNVQLDEHCDNEVHELNLEKIKEAIVLMRTKHNRHYRDWVGRNDDAETSDVFLQLCLFKEVVFG